MRLCSHLHLGSPPSVLTKPVVEGYTLLKRKPGFLPRELSGAVLGRRKTELEKREEGQGKNISRRIRSESGQKMFCQALVSDMASLDSFSNPVYFQMALGRTLLGVWENL